MSRTRPQVSRMSASNTQFDPQFPQTSVSGASNECLKCLKYIVSASSASKVNPKCLRRVPQVPHFGASGASVPQIEIHNKRWSPERAPIDHPGAFLNL